MSQVSKRLRETDLIQKALSALERSLKQQDALAGDYNGFDYSETNDHYDEIMAENDVIELQNSYTSP